MKILVTGSNGFVGKYLKEEIISRKHEFAGIDMISNDCSTLKCDITDQVALRDAISKIKPDLVIHLAAISRVNFENPGLLYSINTIGTLNLVTSLTKDARFMYISSSQVYGNVKENELPVSEDSPVNPVNHYGASKAAAENIIRAFIYENELKAVIARPFNHTGVGQTDDFVVPKIVNAFKRKDSSISLGNINTRRDFLDVRDVTKAYVDIADNFMSGEIYNISSGRELMISDIISILKNKTHHDLAVVNAEYLERKSEIKSVVGTSEKIKKDIKWVPKYSIDDTLMWMVN